MSTKKSYFLRLFLLLILVQFGSFLLFAKKRQPGDFEQYFPQNRHFERGTTFQFIALRTNLWETLNLEQKKELEHLAQKYKYKFFRNIDEVPPEMVFMDRITKSRIPKDGFIFGFRETHSGLFWRIVEFSDYEAPLAASSTPSVYIWLLFTWIKIGELGTQVS